MKRFAPLLGVSLLVVAGLFGCAAEEVTESEAPAENEVPTADAAADSSEQGTLELVANGEDFVRQGFVTKDGWQIDFEHVYVTLDDVTAYQSDPPFDPDQTKELQATTEIAFIEQPETIDLAVGDDNAAPVAVAATKAPVGTYNALQWAVVEASQGAAAGSTILLEGTATKADQTIDFIMGFNQPLEYTCGQFVGDQRKGILAGASETAEIETTFHFDHIFGDAEAPVDDALNVDAVGFDPFATLAQNGSLNVDMATLEQELPSEQYQKLQTAIAGLGHVGEGHCRLAE